MSNKKATGSQVRAPTTQQKHAKFNATPPAVGGQRTTIVRHTSSARQRRLKGKRKENVWEEMQLHLTPSSIQTLKFMMSPGDITATRGIPDSNMTATGFYVRKLDGLDIPKSPLFPPSDEKWDLLILTLPSLDTPLITMQKLTSQSAFSWNLSGPDVLTNGTVLTYHMWSDVERRTEHGERAGKDGVDAPQSVMYNTWRLSLADALTDIPVTYFTQILASAATIDAQIAAWRCTGLSTTTFLNSNATENEGIVYARPLERRLKEVTQKCRTFGISAPLVSTQPGDATTYIFDVSVPTMLLTDIPEDIVQLGTSPHYKGNAWEGCYTVSPFDGESDFLDTIADRVVLKTSTFVSATNGVYDAGKPALTPVEYFAANGTGTPFEVNSLRFTQLDPAFIPTLQIYKGLDADVSISIKTHMGVEFTPTATGTLANFANPAPAAEPMFTEYAEALQHLLEPGYPASANGAWDVIKQIGSGAWDVFKTVAPVLLTLAKTA